MLGPWFNRKCDAMNDEICAPGGVALGDLSSTIDKKLIDGVAVNGSAKLVDLAANLLRRTQSGFLYHYAFAMILGLIALLAVLMTYWR